MYAFQGKTRKKVVYNNVRQGRNKVCGAESKILATMQDLHFISYFILC